MQGVAIQLVPFGDLLMYVGMGLLSILGGMSAYMPRRLRILDERRSA